MANLGTRDQELAELLERAGKVLSRSKQLMQQTERLLKQSDEDAQVELPASEPQ